MSQGSRSHASLLRQTLRQIFGNRESRRSGYWGPSAVADRDCESPTCMGFREYRHQQLPRTLYRSLQPSTTQCNNEWPHSQDSESSKDTTPRSTHSIGIGQQCSFPVLSDHRGQATGMFFLNTTLRLASQTYYDGLQARAAGDRIRAITSPSRYSRKPASSLEAINAQKVCLPKAFSPFWKPWSIS